MQTGYQAVIDKYYPHNDELRHILLTHSRSVADLALALAKRLPEQDLDLQFIEEAAMLHDIGIVRCDAPSIHCHGTKPYIAHGRQGAEMLRAEGMPRHARVCERHTGAGITRQSIEAQQLPLPLQDFLPETLEEQLICYADKFFSKTKLDRQKSVEQAEKSLAKFGEDGLVRFRAWVERFGEPPIVLPAT
jgi:HDIG domain protein